MEQPRIDSFRFARGRREAHAALDTLLDSVRDGGTDFGRAMLELMFQNGTQTRRVLTVERWARVGGCEGPRAAARGA